MKAGWHFSSLWILRIYPVSEQRFMHIRAGLVILLMLIIIVVVIIIILLIYCHFCIFEN
jgi:heme/copper-type cytochrome/quinol oxidase subunit 2